MFWLIVAVIFIAFLLFLFVVSPLISPKKMDLKGAHVLVTGGSSGIGKALAVQALKLGANVTLLARNQSRLKEAKDSIEKHKTDGSQTVLCISVDLVKDYGAVEKAVRQAEDQLGPVDMLINSAGYSIGGRFEDIPLEEFKRMMDINYLGGVYAIRTVLPGMKQRQKGRIVMLSSQAGQLGLFGYTGYSASKFALRGLAESLQMEVKPYNIHVTLAFPPDTDTPGYAEEMKTKPPETKLISETAGLFQAEYVAKVILNSAAQGTFLCHMGLDGYMLATVTSGMSPVTSVMEAVQQVGLMGIFRAISLVYLDSFNRIVSKCAKERQEKDKERKDR